MSRIFNQTFSADKPIYYPSNWQSGKTAYQIYQEWKSSTSYFILSNSMESVIAAFWIFLIYVLLNAIKQMYRLYNLPDDKRQKIQNRRFISNNFIMSTSFIAFVMISITSILLFINSNIKYALLKGVFLWILILSLKWTYKKAINVSNNNKIKKNQYQKVHKQEENL